MLGKAYVTMNSFFDSFRRLSMLKIQKLLKKVLLLRRAIYFSNNILVNFLHLIRLPRQRKLESKAVQKKIFLNIDCNFIQTKMLMLTWHIFL